jgi:hypothetical protein
MPLLQKAYQAGGEQPNMGYLPNIDPEQLKQAEEMFKNMTEQALLLPSELDLLFNKLE